MTMLFRLFICLLLLLFVCPLPVYSAEQQESRIRLQRIQQRIEQAGISLKDQQHQERSMLRDLSIINTSLSEIDRRISALQRQHRQGKKNIAQLRTEISQGQRDMRGQERMLKKRLTALYKEGNHGILKLLFSSTSPMELAEQYEYISRILEHDKLLVADFRDGLTQQRSRLTRLQTLQAEQKLHLARENSEREDARSGRRLQAQLLDRVRRDKTQLHAELKRLKEKAQRLTELLSNLRQQKVRQPGKFSERKGKLPWPLRGALLVGFGTHRDPEFGTLYDSHGIEISAKKGTKMRAVAAGKVVFASWFKGYGNLLIVAHTGGFHSLYAQTDSLLKRAGDRVEAGEPLALAGLAGEQGVYFEIRKDGSPVDPLGWLTPR